MAKINEVKRLISDDFKPDDRDLVSKLAFIINPFFTSIVNALNKSLTFQDNFNANIVNIEVNAPINAANPVTVKTGLRSNCQGIIIISVLNSTSSSTPLSGAPFIEFINSDTGQIQINNITGLVASNSYVIRAILLG